MGHQVQIAEIHGRRVRQRLFHHGGAVFAVAQIRQLFIQAQAAQGAPGRRPVEGRAVLKTEQNADTPGGGLGVDVGAGLVAFGHLVQGPAIGLGHLPVLRQAKGDRAARIAADIGHPADLALD